MAKVTTQASGKTVNVLVDDEVLHTVTSPAAAAGLVQWLEFQLGAGAGVADLRRMLEGKQPKATSGYTGGADAIAGEREHKPSTLLDLSFLDGRITKVKKEIESGRYDAVLETVLEAERSGKDRVTAVRAIEARIEEITQ